MSYDSKGYRGTFGRGQTASPGADVPPTLDQIDGFIEVIDSLRPLDISMSEDFTQTLQRDSQPRVPIIVELHPEPHNPLRTERPLGLAVARDIVKGRRNQLGWKNHQGPGIYTVTKTVYIAEIPPQGQSERPDLRAMVEEDTRPFITLGKQPSGIEYRPASKDELIDAIDTIFMVASGITTVSPPPNRATRPIISPFFY